MTYLTPATKALIVICILFVILSQVGSYCLNGEETIEKDVIYLKNGQKIISEATTSGSMYIYYLQSGQKKIIKKSEVQDIIRGAIIEKVARRQFVYGYLSEALHIEVVTIDSILFWIRFIFRGALFVALAIGAISMVRKRFGQPERQKPAFNKQATEGGGAGELPPDVMETDDSSSAVDKVDAETTVPPAQTPKNDLEKVVQFFLNLYKVQLKMPPQSQGNWQRLDEKPGHGMHIYELSVKTEKKWMRRRMTIGPLGEGSGSKSICFYVIYGSHMVVKIPPKGITDFYLYVEDILKEEKIVAQLQPRTCIIPKISVILKKIYPFPDSQGLSPEQLESKYLKWIGNNATYQSYLKIGGSFVFFMDLSNYFFLESVITELHEFGQKPSEEIISQFELIWRPEAFVQRYGDETEPICYAVQELYLVFEEQLQAFIEAQHQKAVIPEYAKKRWFFLMIGGRTIEKDESDLAPDLLKAVNAWAHDFLKKHKKETNLYRKTVLNRIREQFLELNKPKKESIVFNLLDLLVWLKDKKVALRDLKPDNLLVVGEKEKYPQFLAATDKFSIGIIDLETATSIDTDGNQTIKQPRLGGTPFYATPSHLLTNEILEKTYGDLAFTLHLQDWHATIAMIFKTVTGKTLFENTAGLFPTIFRGFQQMYAHPEDQARTVQAMSQLFWQKALHEYKEAVEKNQVLLASVIAPIPLPIAKILKPGLQQVFRPILEKIKAHVDTQNIFKSEKKRKDLITFSAARIRNLSRKWAAETKDADQKEAQTVIDYFEQLALLKEEAEKLSGVIELLNRQPPAMPADALLNEMFMHIYQFMNKPEWQIDAASGEFAVDDATDDDMSYEATL